MTSEAFGSPRPRVSALARFVNRAFSGGPRSAVVANQLPFAFTFLVVVVLVRLTSRTAFETPEFLIGAAIGVAATVAAAAVPWPRRTSLLILAIPLADFVAIGLTRSATLQVIGALGLLCIFPAVWLAYHFYWKGVLLGTAATVVVLVVPDLTTGADFDLKFWFRVLLLPFIVLMLGAAIAVVTEYWRVQQAELRDNEKSARRASQLLETIIDTVDIGLLTIDADGNDVLYNRRQLQFHDLASPNDAVDPTEAGHFLFDVDTAAPIPVADRPVVRTIAGEMLTDFQMAMGRDPLQRRIVSVTSRPILDDDGAADGAVIAFQDVTEMNAAMRSKDSFVATVSHELRTPLTSIIGYLSLIDDGREDGDYDLPPEVVGHLAVISRNAEQLLLLVSDLLTTAQAEAGSLRFRMTDVRIDQLATRALESFRPRASAADVTLKVEIDPTPIQSGDHGRLSQVLDNVLSNAIKYTRPGGTVLVRVEATGSASVVTVTDSGIGMSSADVGMLFTKFFRADTARENAIPGIGLGLVISKAIVDGHEGSIVVTSTLGVGTTIQVTLPRLGA
ncbi:PAS fold-containing protein [Sanguibacter gelidistatuariae]|uniref:histidine kinase n=1 Tax=Sanguibacter gelidistatuariae TaxID=1814289 RepID=A0A1G6QFP3_9MICO|nr:HAMP domain-containing sensor histidine kinase [Sanguibacter gelidistatuariae]SDC91322.1 PAS fold-containing protein [Sanguibacter gelidistatuariae]